MLKVGFVQHLEVERVVVLRTEMLGRDEDVELEDGEVCVCCRGGLVDAREEEEGRRKLTRKSEIVSAALGLGKEHRDVQARDSDFGGSGRSDLRGGVTGRVIDRVEHVRLRKVSRVNAASGGQGRSEAKRTMAARR